MKKLNLTEEYTVYYKYMENGFAKFGEVVVKAATKSSHGEVAIDHVKKNPTHVVVKVVLK